MNSRAISLSLRPQLPSIVSTCLLGIVSSSPAFALPRQDINSIVQTTEIFYDLFHPAFSTLRSSNQGANPYGLPDDGWGWPIHVNHGDLDGDGHDELVYVAEQRLVMAVKIFKTSGQLRANPKVLWIYFDGGGDIYKKPYGLDVAGIADYDGDGDNEVAVVIGPSPGHASHRIAMIEGPALTVDMNFTVPIADIRATYPVDSLVSGWTGSTLIHGGNNYVVQSCQYVDPNTPPEVFVSCRENGRYGILSYDGSSLTPVQSGRYSRPDPDNPGDLIYDATHGLTMVDVNGDGHQDLLNNGVIDLWNDFHPSGNPANSVSWDLFTSGLPFLPTGPPLTGDNAIDEIKLWDHDGDGVKSFLVHHDYFDLLIEGPTPTAGPSIIWENVRRNDNSVAHYHGQTSVLARLVTGPDAFGYDSSLLHYVAGPKGTVFASKGSVTLNGEGEELAQNINGPGNVFGPSRVGLTCINWSGGPTQQVGSFNLQDGHFAVWYLREKSSSDQFLPYEWVRTYDLPIVGGSGTVVPKNLDVYDFFGSSREEIVQYGTRGVAIRQNIAP